VTVESVETSRASWEEYALELAYAASVRSEDPFVKVGACVLRKDMSVAAVGYNGAPSGVEIDWSDRTQRRKRVIHAELNALRYVKPNEGHLIACTLLPCSSCVQAVAAHGIKTIIYNDLYKVDDFALVLCKEFGIDLKQRKR
jgi:dCMP deaminase